MRRCPRCNAERGILIVAEPEFERGYRRAGQLEEEQTEDDDTGTALFMRLRERVEGREELA